MPQANQTADTGLSTQRIIGWMIRDGFEITIVTNAQRTGGAADL